MSVETQAASLATAVNGLVSAVNTAKGTLDTNVASAQTAHAATKAACDACNEAANDCAQRVDTVYEALQSAGSLASYQDLAAVATSKTDTAIDIFVYDTKQDSDGGAWRHRTSCKSWYNEELGTTTRGTRREFPSVAVIVLQDGKLTVYDADDPALPMWREMVGTARPYDNSLADIWWRGTASSSTGRYSLTAFGGVICAGQESTTAPSNGGGLFVFNLLGDYVHQRYTFYGGNTGYAVDLLSNTIGKIPYEHKLTALIGHGVNGVAMTVLPDAPVDPVTGLPTPTIAVATVDGVSVINQDGTVTSRDDLVYNSTAFKYAADIGFDEQNNIWVTTWNHYPTTRGYVVWDLGLTTLLAYFATHPYGRPTYSGVLISSINAVVPNRAIGSLHHGLTHIQYDPNATDTLHNLLAYTTKDFATGWMPGDTKLATLSSTSTSNLTGASLVTGDDSTFTSSAGNWVSAFNATLASVNGEFEVTSTGSSHARAVLQITGLTAGATYTVTVDARSDGTHPAILQTVNSLQGHTTGGINTSTNSTTAVQMTGTFTTASTTAYIGLGFQGAATTGAKNYFDNFRFFASEPDRTSYNTGCEVVGTISRAPVATGAELVGYSGFHATGTESTSTFLKQPYNSGLNFGTGEFAIMWWHYKTAAATRYVMDRKGSTNTGKWTVYSDTSGKLAFFAYDQLGTIVSGGTLLATNPSPINSWVMNAVVRDSEGTLRLYTDGKLNGSRTGFTGDITDTSADAVLDIGNRWDHANAWEGSLALLRISTRAPTADQIKYIYEQERHLFKENAACTLYGTSNAVNGLAYDKTSGLLYAGSPQGRSTFQGLQRVDNTTTGVTTAISANDGVVIEQ